MPDHGRIMMNKDCFHENDDLVMAQASPGPVQAPAATRRADGSREHHVSGFGRPVIENAAQVSLGFEAYSTEGARGIDPGDSAGSFHRHAATSRPYAMSHT